MYLKILSLVVCLIILAGLFYRKRKKIHMSLMLTAFTIDIGMVLYIELTRKAINTALHPTHPFVIFHVIISVLVVIAYILQIFSGFKLLRSLSLKKFHITVGVCFVVLRLGNFITSLFIENFVKR